MVAPFPTTGAPQPELGAAAHISRRTMLGRMGRGAGALFGAAFLAACEFNASTPGAAADASVAGTSGDEVADWAAWWRRQPQANRLNFANWPYYIDIDGNRRPSLELFTSETDINVNYLHTIEGNDTFFEEIVPYLEAGLPPYYDLIVMTNGPQVTKLIDSGWLTPLDHSRMPNFDRYAGELVRDPSWDPGNRYTVAWQSGITGIAFRPEAAEALGREPTSINDLFDPALEGRVGMMSDTLDLGSAGLLALGIDPGSSTEDDWLRAADRLREQRGGGLVRDYYGQSYIGAIRNGDIWASQAWSGDVFQAQQLGSGGLQFVVPEEGAMLWTDNLMIPRNAKHPVDAMTYIDFVYRPDVAAMIADWVWYISPVPAARRIIANRLDDPEVAGSPLVFPTADTLAPAGSLKQYRVFENDAAAASWSSIFGSIPFGL
jgi:spermidine/putrescine transport system substrate-binding protein